MQYNIKLIYTLIVVMQFSQFHQLQSFKQSRLDYQNIQHCDESIIIFQQSTPQQFNSVLNEIHSINHSRSLASPALDELNFNIEPISIDSQITTNENNEQQIMFTPVKIFNCSPRKSNIFTSTRSTSEKCLTSSPHNNNSIQIYYFGQNICKHIQYVENATIDSLINKALLLYASDLSIDQTFVKSNDPKDYQLRFIQSQGSFKPDMTIQPIARDRNLIDSLFEVLVMVAKNNSVKENSNKKQQEVENSKSFNLLQSSNQIIQGNQSQNQHIKLHILNQANTLITSLILNKNDTLDKAIQFLEAQLKQKIMLCESLQDSLELPSDIDVKNLGTYKLYAKKKKYLDEPQIEGIPLKINSTITKDPSVTILPPIGITQASRYQQYQVIKINTRGVQQSRIMGIDQTKLYNYDVQVRKKNKQASIFSLILGNNLLTGTKKPYRLITQVVQVKSLPNLNFVVVMKEKNIQFKAQSQLQKQKILRKLNFLIQYNSQFKKNSI